MNLPAPIKNLITDKPFTESRTGRSGSMVLVFDEWVLKIENLRRDEDGSDGDGAYEVNLKKHLKTLEVLEWLKGKLPVPEVISHEVVDGKEFLLMTKMKGRMASDEYYKERPEELVRLLAVGLKSLWEVDPGDCPRERTQEVELMEARYRVNNNLVDLNDVNPATFGEGGFKDPEDLLRWLEDNLPVYEPVFSHGDFCLPNIFLSRGRVTGYIDLGDAGIGDKWRDIALCYRSLKHNMEGRYGGKAHPDFDPKRLFRELEMEPNWEKINYYILLDELY